MVQLKERHKKSKYFYSIFRKMWKYYQIFQVGILIQIPGKKTTEEVV